MSNSWRFAHKKTIDDFLSFLNKKTDQYILKGGTALLTCYGLNRFSEDIDLDGKKKDIISLVDEFCKKHGYTYRIGKDTDTVKRCFVNYGNNGRPLKVEASFRRKDFADAEIRNINGIIVYSINDLCLQKASAYAQRDKIRDLFDLTFITNNFYNELNPFVRSALRSSIEYKGLQQFDYVVKDQPDELIDVDVLAENFLEMFDKLGILSDEEDVELLQDYKDTNTSSLNVNDIIDSAFSRCSDKSNLSKKENIDLDK